MKPARWLIGVAIAVAVASLWAGEFWQEKPYTEWTREQAERLMKDSPWARPVEIRLYEPGLAERSTRAGGSTTGEESSEAGAIPGGSREDRGLEGRFKTYTVQWWSARVVRQAAVRARQLQGSLPTEQAEQFLAVRPSHYIIAVFAPSMKAFEGLSAEELKTKAHLKVKKQKIAPEQVNFLRGPREQLRAIEFYFARQVAGQSLISPEDKSVEFRVELKEETIRAKFELRKMQLGGELDL